MTVDSSLGEVRNRRFRGLQEIGRIAWLGRTPIYLMCTLAALVGNYFVGKDLPWDALDYHLYAGFSAVTDRFSQDYFAAGPQSYFNPYVYVPFYELVRHGLPAVAIGSILAMVQSVLLWLTYELGLLMAPAGARGLAQRMGLLAVVLTCVNPVLLQELGSSFADVTTGTVVLGAWVLLVAAVRAPRASRIICAGLLLGVASALKLTNAIYAVAACVVLLYLPLTAARKCRWLAGFGAATGAGFALVAAPWALQLERQFGNPFFPLLNGIFRSPEFTTEALRHYRFLPDSLGEALWRPFAMVDPVRLVHVELSAPDIRYAALIMLCGFFAVRWALRRVRGPRNAVPTPRVGLVGSDRAAVALACGFVMSWVLWLASSANSRYFLPMSSVAAVLITALLYRLFLSRPKVLGYALAIILGLQGVELWYGGEYRWNAATWGGPWLDISVPARLRTEPNLYLTMGVQSNSFIAPFLAPGSGLMNFSGGYALGPDGPGGNEIKALVARYAPHLRMLINGERLYPNDGAHAPTQDEVDSVLGRFGLRVDSSDCETIRVRGIPDSIRTSLDHSPSEPTQAAQYGARGTLYLLSCRVITSTIDRTAALARQKEVDLIFDRVEDACPKLFQPKRLLTEQVGSLWMRFYINTDLKAWVSKGWVKFVNPIRGDDVVYIGREADWARAPLRLACGRRGHHYFATVIDAKPGS